MIRYVVEFDMSKPKIRLAITPEEAAMLARKAAGGDAHEQFVANIISGFAGGQCTYRGLARQLHTSLNTVVRVMHRARSRGIAGLFQPAEAAGRPSPLRSPGVRQLVASLIASADADQAEAEYIVKQLRKQFQIELAAGSLRYWLRQWKLRRHGPRRQGKQIRSPRMTPESSAFIDAELLRVGEELKRQEDYFPEEHGELRRLKMQQDQLLTVYKSSSGDYPQAAIADELELRTATINKWLKRFWSQGGTVAAMKKLLAMHEAWVDKSPVRATG
jgi:transposase/DNA-binding MarR family transcriptional regulator